jgi:4-hydroxy-2-oxoheptanedioate aldolase
MVETREALERIDEIASTPGLDGIYIGPADLALGLGLAPDLDKTEPEHAAAVERILRACLRNRIIAGIPASNAALVPQEENMPTWGFSSSPSPRIRRCCRQA